MASARSPYPTLPQLRGYLQWDDNEPIVGARVIFSRADGSTVGGTSGACGFFALTINDKRLKGRLQVFSRNDEIFSIDDPKPRNKDARDVIVAVPSRLRPAFKPVARLLARVSGKLLEPTVLPVICAAIQRWVRNEEDQRTALRRVERALPALVQMPELLDAAWAVLDGHAYAREVLRSHVIDLALSAGASARRDFFFAVTSNKGAFGYGSPTSPPGAPGPCAFSADQVAVLYIAAIRIAQSPSDLRALMRGIETGLIGSGRIDHVYRSAIRFLGDDDRQAFGFGMDTLPPLPGDPGIGPPTPPDFNDFIPEIDPCLMVRFSSDLCALPTV